MENTKKKTTTNFISLFFFFFCRQENLRRRRDLSSQIYVNDSTTFTLIKTRHRRSSNSSVFQQDIFPTNTVTADPKAPIDDKIPKMDPTNSYYTYLYREVNASVFTLTLNRLKHYSYYSITVKACREGTGDNCGMFSSHYFNFDLSIS